MDKKSLLKIIDKAVVLFTVIFLLTLTNSIFLNQVGYYGALLLLILRYAVSGENPFRKSGLEIAFILIIISELLSSVLSENQGRAFFYMFKRALIFPVVYMIIASTAYASRGKKYFYFYIGGALVSVLVYLFFSYKHYILNLYNLQQSGPSLFQYPITASEIMSFTVIILFAFIINEKTKLKYKLYIFAGFLLSAAALFSTYKRTGWIGTAAGILIILIIKKQWKILAGCVLIIAAVFIFEKNISEAGYFILKDNSIVQTKFDTEGRAYSILSDGNEYYISDFQEGIKTYRNGSITSVLKTPAPVTELKKWTDNFYIARLLDTRFLLLEKQPDKFVKKDEFITPGFTAGVTSANNYFYVLDNDSGLTVLKDPYNLNNKILLKEFAGCSRFFIDRSNALASSNDSIKVYNIRNGIPSDIILSRKLPEGYNAVFFEKGNGLLSGSKGIILFSLDSSGISFNESDAIKNIYIAEKSGSRLFVIDSPGNIYELKYPFDKKPEIISGNKLPVSPSSICINGDTLYYTFAKESRLLSIFDMYNPSNFNRIAMWRAGWEMFKDHPFFGVGDIDLQEYYVKYKRDYDKEIMGHLHNNFVHVLATLGLFGFIAVCFLLIKILIINLRIFKSFSGMNFYASYALGVVGSFCSVIAAGLTEVNIWDHEILTLVLFTTGLNAAFYYSTGGKKL